MKTALTKGKSIFRNEKGEIDEKKDPYYRRRN
jgi:hypothetical protein